MGGKGREGEGEEKKERGKEGKGEGEGGEGRAGRRLRHGFGGWRPLPTRIVYISVYGIAM